MAKNYIFSTLANDQLYTNWIKGGADLPVKGPSVLVKGGTGVANDRFVTPLGVATEVTDEELIVLEGNPCFCEHKKNGYINVRTKKADAEKVASDMNMKDKSAPLTPASFKEEDQPKMAA